MMSGKSTNMISDYLTYKYNNIPCVYILPDIDNRKYISRNIQKKIDYIKVSSLDENIYESLSKYKIIFIDEVQLYKNIDKLFIEKCLNDNKIIYSTGLNGDINMNSFTNVTKILPYITSLNYKNGLCNICGNPGYYHHIKIPASSNICVGDNNIYSIRCFKHLKN